MEQTAAQLQQLKGIGSTLVKRFQEAGLDSFEKIAQAGEDKLKTIQGLNPNNITSILEQAKKFAQASHPERQAAIEALQLRLAEVRGELQTLAQNTQGRFEAELAGKCGKKLAAELVQLEDSLQNLNFDGKKRARRAGKALDKAHKRVAGIAEDASIKKVRKTLKRARKAVLKAVK